MADAATAHIESPTYAATPVTATCCYVIEVTRSSPLRFATPHDDARLRHIPPTYGHAAIIVVAMTPTDTLRRH